MGTETQNPQDRADWERRLIASTRAEIDGLTIRSLSERLARVNRFAGAEESEYSVLAHSLTVGLVAKARAGDTLAMLAGLMHDGHEAITGDVRYPFKCAEQSHVEDVVQQLLMRALDMPSSLADARDVVHEVDCTVGSAELAILLGRYRDAEICFLSAALTYAWLAMDRDHLCELFIELVTGSKDVVHSEGR